MRDKKMTHTKTKTAGQTDTVTVGAPRPNIATSRIKVSLRDPDMDFLS